METQQKSRNNKGTIKNKNISKMEIHITEKYKRK